MIHLALPTDPEYNLAPDTNRRRIALTIVMTHDGKPPPPDFDFRDPCVCQELTMRPLPDFGAINLPEVAIVNKTGCVASFDGVEVNMLITYPRKNHDQGYYQDDVLSAMDKASLRFVTLQQESKARKLFIRPSGLDRLDMVQHWETEDLTTGLDSIEEFWPRSMARTYSGYYSYLPPNLRAAHELIGFEAPPGGYPNNIFLVGIKQTDGTALGPLQGGEYDRIVKALQHIARVGVPVAGGRQVRGLTRGEVLAVATVRECIKVKHGLY
jgi:hypothetical protein